MKVTIHVDWGDRDVQVSRTSVDVQGWNGPIHQSPVLERLFDLAVSDARKACDVPERAEGDPS